MTKEPKPLKRPKPLNPPPSSVKLRLIAKCATITIPRHVLRTLFIQPNDTVHIEVVDPNTILITKEHIKGSV